MTSEEKKRASEQRKFINESCFKPVPITKKDLYGASHIFSQLEPVISLLKNIKLFLKKKIPTNTGVIFWGPSGLGKTTLARYVATEVGANIIDVRKFPVEKKPGEEKWQPKDIRSLFSLSEAWSKKNKKTIILFFDQIDDWLRENKSVISELEIELDGISTKRKGVFIISTSLKRPDTSLLGNEKISKTFKPSLFREGRIGIHIAFIYPDRKKQSELLQGFLNENPHEKDINCRNIVYLLDKTTPAKIKHLVGKARMQAEMDHILNGQKLSITKEHILDVFLKEIIDPPSGDETSEEDKRRTRVHEIGHYIVLRAWGLPARLVSVRSGLETLGFVEVTDDFLNKNLDYLRYNLAGSCGARESEKMFGFKIDEGSEADIENINSAAEKLIFYGDRKHLKRSSLFDVSRDLDRRTYISGPLLVDFEKDMEWHIEREQTRARYTLKFFGKKIIEKVSDALEKKPHLIMLQEEIDKLLQPKLSEFQKKHKIKDYIND